MTDHFWDVKHREKLEEDGLRHQIDSISTAINLARRVEMVRNAPGFSDFLRAIQDLRDVATRRLSADETLTDQGLREQRGRVRALEDVLALLMRPQITETLAKQLDERKNALDAALRRRPKPTSEVP